MKIQNGPDFRSGLALVATGAGFALGALQYPLGRSAQPGPGYFPLLLGVVLALLGGLLAAKALVVPPGPQEDLGAMAWRPLLVVNAAIVLFGFLLPRAGLALTVPVLVVVVGMASPSFRWRTSLASAAVLTLSTWLVFVVLLKLPLPVWPVWPVWPTVA